MRVAVLLALLVLLVLSNHTFGSTPEIVGIILSSFFLFHSLILLLECKPHLVVGTNQMDPPGSKEFDTFSLRKRSGPYQ